MDTDSFQTYFNTETAFRLLSGHEECFEMTIN